MSPSIHLLNPDYAKLSTSIFGRKSSPAKITPRNPTQNTPSKGHVTQASDNLAGCTSLTGILLTLNLKESACMAVRENRDVEEVEGSGITKDAEPQRASLATLPAELLAPIFLANGVCACLCLGLTCRRLYVFCTCLVSFRPNLHKTQDYHNITSLSFILLGYWRDVKL